MLGRRAGIPGESSGEVVEGSMKLEQRSRRESRLILFIIFGNFFMVLVVVSRSATESCLLCKPMPDTTQFLRC